MTGRSDEHRLHGDALQAILAAHGVGVDRAAAGAALVVVDDPLRIVWANRAATRLFGSDDPGALAAALFDGRARENLAFAVQGLIFGGAPRTERLRLLQGFQTRTLTVLLSRHAGPDGQDVVVATMPVAGPDRGADPAFAFDALRWPEPGPTEDSAGPETPAEVPSVPATGRQRFLWRTDAVHRLVEVSGVPPGLRDLDGATRRGLQLSALLAGLGADPGAAVAAALATERAWSAVRVPWPMAGDRGPVAVLLGGVPVRDASGGFAGFRGFGTADFDAPAEADLPIAPPAAPETEPLPADPLDAEPFSPDAEASPDSAPGDASAPETDAAEPPEARPESAALVEPPAAPVEVRASFSSAKIVALRPSRLQTGSGPLLDPASAGAPGARDETLEREGGSPGSSNLSFVEQLNFGEIARALRDSRPGAGTPAVAPGTAEQAEAVLAVLPVAVVVERGGETVYVNPAFLALTGYASVAAFVEAGGRPHLLGGLDAAQVAEADHDRAFPAIDAAGRVLSVQGRLTVLHGRGAVAEVLSLRLAPDGVAELQSLQFEIARREAESSGYRTLLDRVTDPAVIVDGQGRILALNRPGERMFGRDQAEVVGESLGALLTPDSQSAALGAVFRAASAGIDAAEAQLAVTARRREGASLPLAATVGALSGGTVGLVFRDDSEMRTQRETIAVLRAERDRSGSARSDFLGKVSHEIRTPLNAILGFAEVMLDERFGPLGNPRYKDYLADIHAAGRHVIDVVSDLMDLSAVETGQHALTVAATDVNAIIRDSVGDMQGQAHRDRVIVRLSLTAGLPRALVDAQAMRQVIDNILSNAIRFNEPGGQVIVSTTAGEDEAITVRVRDTGVGMSDAQLAIAMEPFRDISTGKPGGGSGLGLPLTRALVEANQATLSIKSRKSEGTLVEVVLRAAPLDEPVPVPVA